MTPRATGAPLLEARGLTKAYGAGTVLDGVSFAAAPNTVVGIVGENGAGKSTLFNILCGVTQPDAGEMSLGGRPFRPRNLAEANRAGVSRVFQEQALIPHIGVYENLLLGHEALFCHGPLVRQRAMLDVARRILSLARLEAIDPGAPTSALSFSKRQLIEIARACFTPREVLGVEQGGVLLRGADRVAAQGGGARVLRHDRQAARARLGPVRLAPADRGPPGQRPCPRSQGRLLGRRARSREHQPARAAQPDGRSRARRRLLPRASAAGRARRPGGPTRPRADTGGRFHE